ncbi:MULTISPECIES: 50S ribosomal protein L9 [Trueperella]|uniref:Large ribosomal subunit protein bL9 n=1 Tax=Trueperella abortisuis TaxID=445930 RepID=A0ABT9PF72_9ACTO|nr:MULTISPECIES: 50S ribosomal protein L9 [Trueperella]MCI7305947.1 50S ribosomal protein L9 [Trueperella sp.]MDP9831353.1 large subunit ribosomal protein L9 [Trueperella abortisuis]MDY5404174.1 50S ribosomal protein L9 [Trueperella sp.]
MKIILTHEVEKLGQPGDVVTVKDGYGRNYLIPRGYATAWTKGAQRQIDQINEARRRRVTEDLESARESRDALEATTLQIAKTAGENGRLFGAVTTADVAAAAAAVTGKTVDRRQVHLISAIKSVGEYTGSIKLGDEIVANVKINVVGE